jgi:hypothetical protein
MNNNKLNFEEGSVSFWAEGDKIDWSGNDPIVLFESSSEGNSILILKDSDAKLKFFHVLFGKGRTDVELDVACLNSSEKHFVVATWSFKLREIALYVDGNKLVESKKISDDIK